MRKSKYDKYVCLACLLIFFYSFFIIGYHPVMESELQYPERPFWWLGQGRDDVVAYVEYPSAVLVAPLVCIVFLCLWLFGDELLEVDRYWLKDLIGERVKAFKEYVRDESRKRD